VKLTWNGTKPGLVLGQIVEPGGSIEVNDEAIAKKIVRSTKGWTIDAEKAAPARPRHTEPAEEGA
jgi:hypothetical protein